MNKKVIGASALAAAVFILSCQSTIRHRLLLSEGQAPAQFSQVIPIKIARGLLVIPAKVQGVQLQMLLDSGAFESKITTQHAQTLNLPTLLSRTNSDTFGRTRQLDITRLENLTLGDVRFENVSAGMLTYPKSAYTPCVAPDGILGGNLLKLTNWQVDYGRAELTLSSLAQPLDIPEDAIAIDMETSSLSAVPKIDIQINGEVIRDVMVDLGFNGGLILPSESVSLPEAKRTYVMDGARSGIYGKTEGQSYLSKVQLRLGTTSVQNTATREVEAEFTKHSGKKIGNAILSHYLVIADNRRNKLYLAPREQPEAFSKSMVNHGYLFGINENTKHWEVIYVESQPGKPAPQLQYGEQLTHINGKTPEAQFANHCEWFMGIRDFLDTPTLTVKKLSGTSLTLSQ